MGKTLVSMRLEDELLAWAASYAAERGSNRTVVVEEALRHLRDLSEGGVPDLPEEAPPVVASRVEVAARAAAGRVVPAASLVARQRANPQGMTRQERVNRLGQGPRK